MLTAAGAGTGARSPHASDCLRSRMSENARGQPDAQGPGGAAPAAPRPESAVELKAVIEAERRGAPFLVFRDGAGGQRLHFLDGAATVTIGRADGADVCLSWDPSVSSVHAEVAAVAGHWLISDEGLSRNGTFVNTERLSGRRRLRHGDVLRIGRTAIAFNDAAPEPSSRTVAIETDADAPRVTEAQQRVLTALCGPYREHSRFATPATNQQIAEELFLSVEAVKTHLRELYRRFNLEELPQNQKRARLVERALQLGLAGPRRS